MARARVWVSLIFAACRGPTVEPIDEQPFSQPCVLPSGVQMAFDSDRAPGNRDLYLLTGCELERLTDDPAEDLEPAFSPDGLKLAFVSGRDGTAMQVFVMDLASRAVHQVTTGGGRLPSWSPDGARIAFERVHKVYLIDSDGTGERQLSPPPHPGCPTTGFYSPAFTRDPNLLLIDRANAIELIDRNGVLQHQVVTNTTRQVQSPALSPDGFHVAFIDWCDGDHTTRLQITPVGTTTQACSGETITVAREASGRPAWGSDFLAWSQGGEIWLLPSSAIGTPVNATQSDGNDDNPAFAIKP
jgi:Tol biopolymer transport system component